MITDYRFKKEFVKQYLKTDKKHILHKGYIYSIRKDAKNFNPEFDKKFTIQEFYNFITFDLSKIY